MAVGTAVWRTPLFLEIWFFPLLFAIPAHALIELPEHWGRNHDSLDVRTNTRTIKASWFGTWYTNGNNYHIEHHWLPAVPNDRFPELHRTIVGEIQTESYPAFYWRFFQELYRNTFLGSRPESGPATAG
jgi:fatty acid desaturase